MANKYMKLFSTLAIKEMQIKTVSRFYVTPVRMMIINKNTPSKKKPHNKCWRRSGKKRNPYILLEGNKTSTTTIEPSMEVPDKAENRTS
jgi:hypothetical protein